MNREELLKVAKPILFNTEMVQAILDERKSVTRRVVKQKYWDSIFELYNGVLCETEPETPPIDLGNGNKQFKVRRFVECKAPYKVGDILYARETWCKLYKLDGNDQIIKETEKYYYRAEGENPTPFNHFLDENTGEFNEYPKWKPSIHMPKSAARIFLKVKDVRVERLQDIWASETSKEGIFYSKPTSVDEMIHAFSDLWNSTIKKQDINKYGWKANPWVWVIEFERIAV